MTLIIARVDEGSVHVVSDTLLSKINGERLPYRQCVIKTVLINLECCVCFAGNPDPANEAIAHLISADYKSDNKILDYLWNIHHKYSQSIDFGVITNISGEPGLHSLKSGEPKTNIPHFWLGEHYNEFQTRFAALSEELGVPRRMQDSLQTIIQDGNVASIGGFQVSVNTDNDSFQYEDANGKRTITGFSYGFGVQHVFDCPQIIEIKRAGEPQKMGGGSEDSISTFSSISPYYPGIAIHYKHANTGYLFCPHLRMRLGQAEVVLEPFFFSEVGPEEFLDIILDKYDIQFRGFITSDDGRFTYVNS